MNVGNGRPGSYTGITYMARGYDCKKKTEAPKSSWVWRIPESVWFTAKSILGYEGDQVCLVKKDLNGRVVEIKSTGLTKEALERLQSQSDSERFDQSLVAERKKCSKILETLLKSFLGNPNLNVSPYALEGVDFLIKTEDVGSLLLICMSNDPVGIFRSISRYPVLWKGDSPLIKQDIFQDILLMDNGGNVLSFFAEHPEAKVLIKEPVFVKILKAKEPVRVLKEIIKYPQFKDLIQLPVFEQILASKHAVEALKGLGKNSYLFEKAKSGTVKADLLVNYARIVRLIKYLKRGTNDKFNISDKDIENLFNTYPDVSIPKKLDVKAFIEKVLSRIFAAKEKEILDKIPPNILKNRKKLVEYLKAQTPRDYVLEKLTVQAEVWREMGKNEKMKNFPFEEIWRFVIDGMHEDKGPYYFEDEPGYIVASLKALLKALQGIDNPTLKWYAGLHDEAVGEVFKEGKRGRYEEFEKGIYLNTGVPGPDYLIGKGRYDSDYDDMGIRDLKERGSGKSQPRPFIFKESEKIIQSVYDYESAPKIFSKFNEFVSKEENPVMRLMANVWLVREMELRHLFGDANRRTAMFGLYCFVAKDLDLPMVLLHNPAVIDGNGPEKLLCRLIESMEKFKNNGAWKRKGHQNTHTSMLLDDLDCPEFEGLIKYGIDQVQDKDWDYFHKLIMGE